MSQQAVAGRQAGRHVSEPAGRHESAGSRQAARQAGTRQSQQAGRQAGTCQGQQAAGRHVSKSAGSMCAWLHVGSMHATTPNPQQRLPATRRTCDLEDRVCVARCFLAVHLEPWELPARVFALFIQPHHTMQTLLAVLSGLPGQRVGHI
eukprot:365844-Chlamydomonas_euryale.AAC.6